MPAIANSVWALPQSPRIGHDRVDARAVRVDDAVADDVLAVHVETWTPKTVSIAVGSWLVRPFWMTE